MNTGTGRRVLQGALWMGGARLFVNGIGFVSTIILARLLTPNDFGLVAIAMAAAAIAASVSDLSLTQALVKFETLSESDFDTAWTLNFFRAIALSCLLVLSSWPLSLAYADARLVPIFAVVAIGSAVRSLENPRIVSYRRSLDFKPDFMFDVCEKLSSFIICIIIAIFYKTYWALVIGNTASVLFRVTLTYVRLPYLPRFKTSSWRSLLSFSIWLTFAEIVKTINQRSIPLLVGFFLPTSVVGQFSVGERVASMPIRETIGALQSTLFPAFSMMKNDVARIRSAYLRAQAMMCLLAVPLGFGLAAIADPVTRLFLGHDWLPAVPVIQAVSIASAIQSIQNPLPLAMASGKTRKVFQRNIRETAIHLPLLLLGLYLSRFFETPGLWGLGLALVVSSIINTFLNLYLIKSIIDIPLKQQLSVAIRPMVVSTAMLISILFVVGRLSINELNFESLISILFVAAFGLFQYIMGTTVLCVIFPKSARYELDFLKMALSKLKNYHRDGM